MKIKSIKRITLDTPLSVYDVINAAPNHNFLISAGSSYIISHNCFLDEVSWARNKNVSEQMRKAKEVFDAALERVQSRFTKFGGIFDGLVIMASSKRTDQAFAEVYADELIHGKYGNKVFLVDKPRWEILPAGTYSGKTFPVAVSPDRFKPSEIIKVSDVPKYVAGGYEIIYPPIETIDEFRRDMLSALTNIAGRSVSGAGVYFAGDKVMACVNKSLKNLFTEGTIFVGTRDEANYQDWCDLSRLTPEDLAAPWYIHLDASLGHDGNSISGGRILYAQDQRDSTGLVQPELHFRQLFKIKVRAPKGDRTMLRKNEQFIYWLRSKGIRIAKLTSDQYQCLLKGTLIWTPDGYKPIEELQLGDTVLTYNIQEGLYERAPVLSVWQSRNEKEFTQVNTSRAGIKVTNDHLFLTPYGYKRADELQSYDFIKGTAREFSVHTNLHIDEKLEDNCGFDCSSMQRTLCRLFKLWGVSFIVKDGFYIPEKGLKIEYKDVSKYSIKEENGELTLSIPEQQFLDDTEKWILKIFDLLELDGELVIDTKPVVMEEEQPFYDIEVDSDNHNYLTISGIVHNSVQFGQDMTAAGINYGYLSIDRVSHGINQTYQVLRDVVFEQRIELLNDLDQNNELVALVKYPDGRVDKPTGGTDDASQCLCGWVFSATQDKESYVLNNTVLPETILASTSLEEYTLRQGELPPELTIPVSELYNEFGAYKVARNSGVREEYDRIHNSEGKDKKKAPPSPFNFF